MNAANSSSVVSANICSAPLDRSDCHGAARFRPCSVRLQDQVAATVTLLLYLFLVENILTNIPALDGWTPYLPGQAQEALVGSTLTDRHLVTAWQGGVLLAAYALVLVLAGGLVTARRDIT